MRNDDYEREYESRRAGFHAPSFFEDGDVSRCGNVVHETGADANDDL